MNPIYWGVNHNKSLFIHASKDIIRQTNKSSYFHFVYYNFTFLAFQHWGIRHLICPPEESTTGLFMDQIYWGVNQNKYIFFHSCKNLIRHVDKSWHYYDVCYNFTFFAFQRWGFRLLICPPEESSAAVAADPTIVRMVGLARRRLLGADGTNPVILNLLDVCIDHLGPKI